MTTYNGTPLEQMTWRTIETAPKDGTEILAWCHDRAVVTFWGEDMLKDDDTSAWILSYDGADPLWHNQPTHWMPLPEAPNALKG